MSARRPCRAARRRLRREADALAAKAVREGVFEAGGDGRITRMTDPRALAALRREWAAMLRGLADGQRVHVARLTRAEAMGFPAAAAEARTMPADAEAWIGMGVDVAGALTWQVAWLGFHDTGREDEREEAARVVLSHLLAPTCAEPGFLGDTRMKGAA